MSRNGFSEAIIILRELRVEIDNRTRIWTIPLGRYGYKFKGKPYPGTWIG